MNLFLYGTLLSRPLLRAVGGAAFSTEEATLADHAVFGVAGDIVPMLVEAPGRMARGILLRDVDAEAMARFDLYEGAWGYVLRDVMVRVAGQDVPSRVYVAGEGRAHDDADWSLSKWEQTHGPAAALAAEEIYALDPRPDPATLRNRWNMTQGRAWARHRAQGRHDIPAHVRYQPRPGDVEIKPRKPMRGEFFGLQAVDACHNRFDGQPSGPLPREVFIGIDAAIVLPYDPETDRVLLVEQMRMGPAVLGEPNPWVLEPVAGMVDARETPESAALREVAEEAGLHDIELRHIASFYPSPGSSTDYFYTYLGLCSLPDGVTYTGGLESEAEDLRLHPMTFDRAMTLAASGEVSAGPLLLMLYWLAGQRASLRGAAG